MNNLLSEINRIRSISGLGKLSEEKFNKGLMLNEQADDIIRKLNVDDAINKSLRSILDDVTEQIIKQGDEVYVVRITPEGPKPQVVKSSEAESLLRNNPEEYRLLTDDELASGQVRQGSQVEFLNLRNLKELSPEDVKGSFRYDDMVKADGSPSDRWVQAMAGEGDDALKITPDEFIAKIVKGDVDDAIIKKALVRYIKYFDDGMADLFRYNLINLDGNVLKNIKLLYNLPKSQGGGTKVVRELLGEKLGLKADDSFISVIMRENDFRTYSKRVQAVLDYVADSKVSKILGGIYDLGSAAMNKLIAVSCKTPILMVLCYKIGKVSLASWMITIGFLWRGLSGWIEQMSQYITENPRKVAGFFSNEFWKGLSKDAQEGMGTDPAVISVRATKIHQLLQGEYTIDAKYDSIINTELEKYIREKDNIEEDEIIDIQDKTKGWGESDWLAFHRSLEGNPNWNEIGEFFTGQWLGIVDDEGVLDELYKCRSVLEGSQLSNEYLNQFKIELWRDLTNLNIGTTIVGKIAKFTVTAIMGPKADTTVTTAFPFIANLPWAIIYDNGGAIREIQKLSDFQEALKAAQIRIPSYLIAGPSNRSGIEEYNKVYSLKRGVIKEISKFESAYLKANTNQPLQNWVDSLTPKAFNDLYGENIFRFSTAQAEEKMETIQGDAIDDSFFDGLVGKFNKGFPLTAEALDDMSLMDKLFGN